LDAEEFSLTLAPVPIAANAPGIGAASLNGVVSFDAGLKISEAL
jgi:hypothetical protein